MIIHKKPPYGSTTIDVSKTQMEILFVLGDVKEILTNNNIKYHPAIEDLNEEEATKVLDILRDDWDFDYPGGDECRV
jgi:hypothetical protein